MTRLLVLGAGRHQTPLIQRAEDRGIHTIAVDYYEDSPGKAVASSAVLADALDSSAVLEAARTHRVDGVTTVGTDQAMLVVAQVADELELPCHISPSGALAATNKRFMRNALEATGVPMTAGITLSPDDDASRLDELRMPCVVKAADSQGQRGMQRIDDRAALAKAVVVARGNSRTSTVVVEEFETGPELTINAWMRHGEPALMITADRHTFNPTPAIGICLRHVVPSVHAARVDEIEAITLGVAGGYGVTDGPLYIQMLATPRGFRVVEAASRVGGGHEAQLFEAMYGLSLIDLSIDLALDSADRPLPEIAADRAGLVNFVVARPGRVATIDQFQAQGPGAVVHGEWYVGVGHVQSDILDSMGRVGAFIVTDTTRDDALVTAGERYADLSMRDENDQELLFWPEATDLNVPVSLSAPVAESSSADH